MQRTIVLLTLFVWGCATAPVKPPVTAPRETFLSTLTVTATGARVHDAPSTDAPVIASLQPGDRLRLIERQAEWLLVRTPAGVRGYVQPAALVEATCTADRAEPVIVEEPLFRFDDGNPNSRVVLEAEYTAEGRLVVARVLENTTGDPAYAQRAIEDLWAIRFLPPTEDCKARPFFYTFRRYF